MLSFLENLASDANKAKDMSLIEKRLKMTTNLAQRSPSPAQGKGADFEESSIFHDGELEMQKRAGTFDFAQNLGKHKILNHIGPDVKQFVEFRHAIYLSSMDPDSGAVWASVVFADPSGSQIPFTDEAQGSSPTHVQQGRAQEKQAWTPPEVPFCKPLDACSVAVATSTMTSAFQSSAYKQLVQLASPTLLVISKPPVEGDPFWKNARFEGAQVGIGFVEFETRRRFRASGVIKEPVTAKGFSVEIREAFSVCPKYIQRRTIDALHRFPKEPRVLSSDPSDPSLPSHLIDFIVHADTFMIATMTENHLGDASHRGGRPGFIRVVDRRRLLWGDYVGLGLFQTLGNTMLHPETGLLFIDFEKGPTLQLTGTLTVEWTEPGASLDSADRLVIFTVKAWRYHDSASPFHWCFIDMSSHHPMLEDKPSQLGKWAKESIVSIASKQTGDIYRAKIVKIKSETYNVKTIRFKVPIQLTHQPGQYGTFTFEIGGQHRMRSFTLSSANLMKLTGEAGKPVEGAEEYSSPFFEISVKDNPAGVCSKWLNHSAKEGDSVYLLGIEGSFTLDSSYRIATCTRSNKALLNRPAFDWWKVLFLTGGIGLTPVMSMMRGLEKTREGGYLKHEVMPDIFWIHSERTAQGFAFSNEIAHFAESDILKVIVAITEETEPSQDKRPFKDLKGFAAEGEESTLCYGHVDHNVLQQRVPFLADRIAYLCGPNTFMGAMKEYLIQLGVPPAHILTESFDY